MRRFASDIFAPLVLIVAMAAPTGLLAADTAVTANAIQPVDVDIRAQRLAAQIVQRDEADTSAAPTTTSANQTTDVEQQALGGPASALGERLLPKADATGSSWLLSTLGSLGVVIGLILLMRWGWLKMGGRPAVRPNSIVEVLHRTSVAPRNHVLLLRVGGRILIVSDSPGGMHTLADITDPQEVADLLTSVTSSRDGSITRGFSQAVSRFNGEYDSSISESEGVDAGEHRIDRAREAISGALSRIRALGSGKGAV